MITVNNFFAHWVKEISITKYGSDKELPLTFSPWEVYQYSDQMLKHLPKDSLKTIEKNHLYSKVPIHFASTLYDRRNHNSANVVLTGCSKNPNTKNIWNKKRLRLTKCRIFRFKQIIWWIEISIVPDKSDKHTTIYDSYNREMAAQLIKSLRLSNFTEIYSLTNEKKYDVDNLTQRYLPYK